MFKPNGTPRLATMVLAALIVAGLFTVGATAATAADKPAATAQPDKKAKAEKPKKAKAEKPAKKAEPVAAKPKPAKAPKEAKAAAVKPVEKSYAERRAIDGPWAKGSNWLEFRAGYAGAGGENAGDGVGGYGIGYQHMLSNRWSFGANVHHEIVGHMGKSWEMAVPFSAEFVRHYKWKTVLRPYTGIGGGYYFHKYYRTGSDYTGAPGSAWHISLGADMPLDDRHVLGLDTRVGFLKERGATVVNPVFGPEGSTVAIWSVKLNWALTY